MKRKKLAVIGLIIALAASPVVPVRADDTATTTSESSLNSSIDALETQKQELLGQIDDLEAQLVTTIAEINSVNSKLDSLATDIEQTKTDLEAATEDRNTQHEAMKKRIQYIYEKGGDAGWIKVFLEDGDLNAWLNSKDYTSTLYKYDRDQLQSYADSVTKVTNLQQQQNDQEAQLQKNKDTLTNDKTRLETLIAQMKGQYSDADARIADAYQKADQYQALIDQQNQYISQVVTLQSSGSDTQATQSEAGQSSGSAGSSSTSAASAASNAGSSNTSSYAASDTGSSSAAGSTGSTTDNAAASAAIEQAAQQLAASTGTDVSTARQAAQQAYQATGSTSTASGSALLAYAQQFLGNPYVYGGNSLTNGVDCSGFVQQVYSHFGINTSRTSWDIENDGSEVSYSDVQVGDVICYDGHVGIYAGNGQIINAANEAQGITYTNADYDNIVTVRRLLPDGSSS
ncbi:MAG: NlpC/P60 family protein [Eubacterium sp.]|nr:NlpC/P60 family protein [Eubacterium sp.]